MIKLTLCHHDASCAHYILVCNVVMQIQKYAYQVNDEHFIICIPFWILAVMMGLSAPASSNIIIHLSSDFPISNLPNQYEYPTDDISNILVFVRSRKSQKTFKPC